MANMNGQTPEQQAAEIVNGVRTRREEIRSLATRLGVPEHQVEAYIKQQAARKVYQKRQQERMKAFRQAASQFRGTINKLVDQQFAELVEKE